jgi:cytochrome b
MSNQSLEQMGEKIAGLGMRDDVKKPHVSKGNCREIYGHDKSGARSRSTSTRSPARSSSRTSRTDVRVVATHLAHAPPRATVRVGDRFVRSFHWLLVASFAIASACTESIGIVHKAAGYTALALVAARVLWGFIGTRHARFADFVPTPAHSRGYLAALARGEEPRYAGHNPLGALMMAGIAASVRHRENLVLSMITGRKPLATSPRPGDDIGGRCED